MKDFVYVCVGGVVGRDEAFLHVFVIFVVTIIIWNKNFCKREKVRSKLGTMETSLLKSPTFSGDKQLPVIDLIHILAFNQEQGYFCYN